MITWFSRLIGTGWNSFDLIQKVTRMCDVSKCKAVETAIKLFQGNTSIDRDPTKA